MAEGASVQVTANGVVLTSGKPIRLYGYTLQSGSGGPGTVTFYNGTSAGGQQRVQVTGVVNGSSAQTFGIGKKFESGLFVTVDANVTYVNVDVIQEQST